MSFAPLLDPKRLAAQARVQAEHEIATHKAQIDQQQAQNAAIHLQVTQLGKLKASLDARCRSSMRVLHGSYLRFEGKQ